MMTPRRLAVVTDYQSLIEALRARVDELQISYDTLDSLIGWAKGLTGKVLGDAQVKALGMRNLWLAMEALGLQFAIEDNPESLARMERRYERRNGRYRHAHNQFRGISDGARKRLMRELGRAGGRARISKMSPEMLHKFQSKAGKASGKARRRAKRLVHAAPIGTQ